MEKSLPPGRQAATICSMGLDTVELVMSWEECFGISIPDQDAMQLLTPRMVIDYVCVRLALDSHSGPCLGMCAFHRIRAAIVQTTGVQRRDIRRTSRMKDLLSRSSMPHRAAWELVRTTSRFSKLPPPNWLRMRTMEEVTNWTVRHAAHEIKKPGEGWTRPEVRKLVREVISKTLALHDFSDDDRFVEDLDMD